MQSGERFKLPTGEDIRQLRLKRGFSQAHLADKAGVSQPLIARIEKGTINPPLLTVKRILDALYAEIIVEKITAKDIAVKDVITVRINDKLGDAIGKMGQNGVSQVPVLDEAGKIVGGLTEKGLTEVIINEGKESMNSAVVTIMEPKFPEINTEATITEIQDKLLQGAAVVVMDGQKLFGILSKTDLLHYFRSSKE
jgi:predicted transcriptional regulator